MRQLRPLPNLKSTRHDSHGRGERTKPRLHKSEIRIWESAMQTTLETRTSTFHEHVLRIVRTVGVALMIVAVSILVANPAYASENDDSESAGAANLDAPLQMMDRADTIAHLNDLDSAGSSGAGDELRSIDIADKVSALEDNASSDDPDETHRIVRLPRH